MAFVRTRENRYINIEGTHFIFQTNFGGDPARDRFARPGQPVSRRGNVVIPDPDMARMLIDMGVRVRQTEPREGEEDGFVPTYFVPVIASFKHNRPGDEDRNPKIYLVSDGVCSDPLTEDSLAAIDHCYVLNVDVTLSPWENQNTGNVSLYIQTMYVVQDVQDDPYASKYRHRAVDAVPLECEGMDTFA